MAHSSEIWEDESLILILFVGSHEDGWIGKNKLILFEILIQVTFKRVDPNWGFVGSAFIRIEGVCEIESACRDIKSQNVETRTGEGQVPAKQNHGAICVLIIINLIVTGDEQCRRADQFQARVIGSDIELEEHSVIVLCKYEKFCSTRLLSALVFGEREIEELDAAWIDWEAFVKFCKRNRLDEFDDFALLHITDNSETKIGIQDKEEVNWSFRRKNQDIEFFEMQGGISE